MRKSVNDIIREHAKGQLATDPHFYTGRGDPDDLSVGILENMYQGIKQEVGQPAAIGYVHMLDENKEHMNVRLYISALQYVAMCNWNYISKEQEETLKQTPEVREDLVGVNCSMIVRRAERIDGVKPYPEGERGSSYRTTLAFLKNHQEERANHDVALVQSSDLRS